jgi:hypothetical protein
VLLDGDGRSRALRLVVVAGKATYDAMEIDLPEAMTAPVHVLYASEQRSSSQSTADPLIFLIVLSTVGLWRRPLRCWR